MKRKVIQRLEQWAECTLDFLRHLCADWDEIRETLLSGDPGFLVSVNGGAGDLHRRGRCVQIAEFSDGRRLVYKPHSMAVEPHFSPPLVFPTPRALRPPL